MSETNVVDIKKSYKEGSVLYGVLQYNGIHVALTSPKEIVEDFEFDGVVSDVIRCTGIDDENREYEIFWTPKHFFLKNGKYTGTVEDIEHKRTAYYFTSPLTVRRTDWKLAPK